MAVPAQAVCWFHQVNGWAKKGSFIGIKNNSLEKLNRIIKPKIASTNANQKFMETNNTATVKQIPIANEFVPKVLIHQDNDIKTIQGKIVGKVFIKS